MRTVSDIVEAVQTQQPATDEELRLTLLCLYYNSILDAPSDFEGASELKLRLRAQEAFSRRFRVLKAEPDKYLGERYTPGTQANAEGRDLSEKVLAAFERKAKESKR